MIRGTPKRSAAIAVAAVIALQSIRASGAEPVRSVEIVESGAFLEGYRAASEAQSVDFYDLYSDRAVIHIRIQDQDRGIAFQGRAFKAWGRQLLKEGRTGLDASIFRDATVEQRGNRLLIRAKRYSATRCYWDLTYQVGIEREGLSYRIVDERLTTYPAARCGPERIAVDDFRSMTPPMSGFSLSPTPGDARLLDTRRAEWRPLSPQELADKAKQLAQQMASAHAALSSSADAAATASVGAAARLAAPFEGDSPVASTGRSDASSDLRITPTE
jgi:hypothetical protein